MSEPQEHRPTQVTITAAAVIGGALLLFFSGFDSMSNLQTVDLRERLAEAVSSGSAHSFGITVDDLIRWMHVATLVTGGAAAAAAVLGWFAMQRHRGARLALALIAVVLVVCAPFSGGVLAAFVAGAIAMLWSGQARDWFAGRPVRQREPLAAPRGPAGQSRQVLGQSAPGQSAQAGPSASGQGTAANADELPPASQPGAPSAPPPTQGFGDVPTSAPVFGQPGQAPQRPSYPNPEQQWHPQAQQQPVPYQQWQAWQGAPVPTADRRPAGVTAACVLTWVFAGVSAALFVLAALVMLVEPERFVAQFVGQIDSSPQLQDAGVGASMAEPLIWLAIAFYLFWSLAACVLAFLAWRRLSWARILLVVSAFAVVALGAIALLAGGVIAVPHMLAAAVAGGLLVGGNSNRWFARRLPRPGAYPQPGPPPGQQQGPQPPTGGPPPRAW